MLPYISPFSSVLDTNHIPSDEEIVEIRRHIGELAPGVTELDAKIQALQDQRSKYEKYLSRHRSLLSPIKRMPVDILYLIFRHCLPTKHNALMVATQAPILLTHVCRSWRELVIGRPELWSSIYIPIPQRPAVESVLNHTAAWRLQSHGLSDSGSDHGLSGEAARIYEDMLEMWDRTLKQRKEMVVEWLRRASGAALSINLRFASWPGAPMSDEIDSEETRVIINALKGCSKQWKKLEVFSPTRVARELVTMPAAEVPIIEALGITTILTYPRSAIQSAADSSLLFKDGSENTVISAPTLRSLNLRDICDDLGKVSIRWENLTSFEFRGYQATFHIVTPPMNLTPNKALEFLSSCPNLVECGLTITSASRGTQTLNLVLGIVPTEPPEEFRPRTVSLTKLESLWVCESYQEPLNDFFQCLEIPRLAHLQFITSFIPIDQNQQSTYDPLNDPWTQLHQNGNDQALPHPPSLPVLLRACGQGITTLEFDYFYQTPDSLRECLSLVPNVEQLQLNVGNRNGYHDAVPVQYPYDGVGGPGHCMTSMDDETFHSLFIRTHAGSPLCPRMKSFSIRPRSCELWEGTLVDFVRMRRSTKAREQGIVPLERLEVAFAEESESSRKKRREVLSNGKGWMSDGEWIALKELEGDSSVDLEGFSAKVTWPIDPLLKNVLLGCGADPSSAQWKAQVKGPLSPSWGLEVRNIQSVLVHAFAGEFV